MQGWSGVYLCADKEIAAGVLNLISNWELEIRNKYDHYGYPFTDVKDNPD